MLLEAPKSHTLQMFMRYKVHIQYHWVEVMLPRSLFGTFYWLLDEHCI